MSSLVAVRSIGIALALAVCATSTSAEVYRWIDKNGKVQYSDNPPPDAAVEKPRLVGNAVAGEQPSFETRRAMQVAPVKLYVGPDCKEPCDQARKLLSARKIPFAETSITTQEQIDGLAEVTGKKQPRVPTILVGRKVIEGFEAGAWNSALDAAGYPKS